MDFNALGDRMKKNYEERTRYTLPRRTYTIIRLDGKAFHTFTKSFKRPFDQTLIDMMDNTAKALCEQVQGVKMAFVQSDEITLVLTDFDDIKTDAWFDGNIQKMASVSASIATVAFNREYLKSKLVEITDHSDWMKGGSEMLYKHQLDEPLACFDSRVFSVPEHYEVKNCLIWRQEDATKNSISMVAQSLYSHKELHKKNGNQKQEMIFQKGQNWNNLPVGQRRGRVIIRKQTPGTATNQKTGETIEFTRNAWVVAEPPIFTSEEGQAFLNEIIPKNGV